MTIVGDIASIKEDLGDRIRTLREEEHLSQERLALMVGLERTYILDIEKGRRAASVDSLIKLSRGLGVTLSQLLWDIDPENPDMGGADYAFVKTPANK